VPETDANALVIPKYPTGLKARGKRLWRELHGSADFSDLPMTRLRLVAEEECYLVDEIDRQRRLIHGAGDDTRVSGSQGQPVSSSAASCRPKRRRLSSADSPRWSR
jgi:hypothetical protein